MSDEVSEKERRIYYQDIVYAVCNIIERNLGEYVPCGTVDNPTRAVQEVLRECRIVGVSDEKDRWKDPQEVRETGWWWWFNGEQVIPLHVEEYQNDAGVYEYAVFMESLGWPEARDVMDLGGKWRMVLFPLPPGFASGCR